jgi:hypothetical protein
MKAGGSKGCDHMIADQSSSVHKACEDVTIKRVYDVAKCKEWTDEA